jgi:hypothetical protein
VYKQCLRPAGPAPTVADPGGLDSRFDPLGLFHVP